MDINLFRGLMTAILLFAFVGIWVWAWLPGRKKTFDDAAMLPLKGESRPSSVAPTSSGEGEVK